MSPYDISLIKLDKGYGAMQKKRNKRCIPKEGMPHAHKACKKTEKKEKKKEKKIAPIQRKRKRNKREIIHTKEFIHHPPKIYFHTLAHLDQGL